MSFRNVVVGVDGEEGGRDAIALGRLLCAADGRLTLVHVYFGDSVAWRGAGAAYERAERDASRELLELARSQAELDVGLRWHGASSPGRGLHELVEALGGDLLVVGSSRRGLLGRVLLGDDTRAALNGAPCAVAVAPAGYARQSPALREVGVGFNGTPESEHALAVARELADEHHATLSAFEAVALAAYSYSGPIEYHENMISEMVDVARERVAAIPGVQPHAGYGAPAAELGLYSASVDLLVVGSRGYGPLGRLAHGSTTQQLARRAACPLLVLARGARADLDAAERGGTERAHPAGV